MIQAPKRHAPEILDWLDKNVSPNRPNLKYFREDEITVESRWNPWHVSATAQTAIWQGQDGSWQVKQQGNRDLVEIKCRDIRIETYIGMKWT